MKHLNPLTFGSLFAGIGGFDLGLERAGMICKWQVEIDEFCQKVLTKHWPDVPKYRDIRECGDNLERVDLICGGFPCQDVSVAGKRAGITGARSSLWSEYVRIIRILRPRYVLVENVPGLLSSGFGRVLGDLAESGYDAEWYILSAALFGFPHIRNRVLLLAYPSSFRRSFCCNQTILQPPRECFSNNKQPGYRWKRETRRHSANRVGWRIKPNICGSHDGVPSRMDRLKSLGNAVIPQVAEFIGRRIIETHRQHTEG